MKNRLFFELLHEGRRLKRWGFEPIYRRIYYLGMLRAFELHLGEIKAGQNIQDCWRHQRSGAEG